MSNVYVLCLFLRHQIEFNGKPYYYKTTFSVRTLQKHANNFNQNFNKEMFAWFNEKKNYIYRYRVQYFTKFLVLKFLKICKCLNAYEPYILIHFRRWAHAQIFNTKVSILLFWNLQNLRTLLYKLLLNLYIKF